MMMEETFDYNDFNWQMVQSENRFFARAKEDEIKAEYVFIDGEILKGNIVWYDDMSIGIKNEEGEEIYIDKRSLKWIRIF